MTLAWLLVALAAVTASTVPLTRWLGRSAGLPLALAYLGLAALALPAASSVLSGVPVSQATGWVPALDLELALRMDGLSLVFTMIALLIGSVVLAFSARYMAPGRQLDFYVLMTAFTLSMVGLVLADDLILLFLCWELTSLASFLLIARSGSAGEAASARTLLLTFVGGLTLLAAVAATIVGTGTTNLTRALESTVWSERPVFTAVIAVLVAVSGFTKAAQFPFHSWLPDAMAASTPVSAYLHAAAVVKAGIYLMLRFSEAFSQVPAWNYTLLAVGLFTAAMGALFAFQKTDLKKLMAYSTVSQLGLITATIGVGSETALKAATLHTIAHALFKSGLFMMVGAIDHQTGTRDIRRLPPLRRAMPWSFATVVVGTASMAGVPPLLGFVSKEYIFESMLEAPGPAWVGWAALLAAAGGAVLTFAYSARIVTGAFIDGTREDDAVTEAPLGVLLPAALPIWVGLPLAFTVGILNVPVGESVRAMAGPEASLPSLELWHGVSVPLVATAVVIALGLATVRWRRQLGARLAADLLPADGAGLLEALQRRAQRLGRWLGDAVEADHPTRHVVPPLVALSALLLAGAAWTGSTTGLPATSGQLWRWIDVALLILVALGVLGTCLSDSRIGGTVLLGGVGIVVTVQLFALGAPDVGLTQLLVEVLTVTVIMLVLRRLPLRFGRGRHPHRRATLALAVACGTAVGLATWLLTGRRERSEVADYYVAEGEQVTGGTNLVNVILVEFRALDTLGELAVLGMAGVAIWAVLGTVPRHRLDPGTTSGPQLVLRPHGTPPSTATGTSPDRLQAHAALTDAGSNAMPLQLLLRALIPGLVLVSAVLFYRGHNEPGGGFIAALVVSVAIALIYLARPSDQAVAPDRLPVTLIGGGVLVALGTGVAGFAAGGFLEPLYGYLGNYKLASSLVFDVGVYLAVVGLVLATFNLLGAAGSKVEPDDDLADRDLAPDPEPDLEPLEVSG
jgi:multicomponent Na+:H+ antiporter subunit A